MENDVIDRSRRMRRISYIGITLIIWIYAPILVSNALFVFGIPVLDVNTIFKTYESGGTASGLSTRLDLTKFWYLQIPIFLYYTAKRLRDIDWSIYLSILLWIPIINFILWFYPGSKSDNSQGQAPYVSSVLMKMFVFTSPITILMVIFLTTFTGLRVAGA